VPDDEVEGRLGRLEHEVAELREQLALTRSDAAAARVLAAGADRDVSEVRAELRAHTQCLNALRETQLEQGWQIDELRQEVRAQGEEMRAQGREMREGFATLGAGMAQITALLTAIKGPDGDV
jgi:chromosome segregation ATPase